MIDQRPDRLPAQPPTVSRPRPFVDRRVAFRRTEDSDAHREKVLLARALDVLASDAGAEQRLAGLLQLLATTAGAIRTAFVSDGIERRAAVAVDPGDDLAPAEALATWLDANAPRSRARRAAAGRAPISFIVGATATDDDPTHDVAGLRAVSGGHVPNVDGYAMLPIPGAGDVALGFEFARPSDAARLAERLPPDLARHAAVALALVTQQLADDRELATLRARDAERATFTSTVAHELRTPLTGLRGYLELILAGRVDDAEVQRDFLERSRAIVGSMSELVADLLEVSRLESGGLELDLDQFSLAEAAGQVASSVASIALDRSIALTTSLPPRMHVATGDRRRVEQILTNLAANALKFTPPGGAVEIDARFEGPVAVVVVKDNGGGIPAEDRSRIFERFHRMADHQRIMGTGLGLPIARDLAQRMGGDLAVASVPGVGSAFILVLPGPADADQAAIESTLDHVVEVEERGLEEREVMAAIAAGARHRRSRDASGSGGRADLPSTQTARLRALPAVRREDSTLL